MGLPCAATGKFSAAVEDWDRRHKKSRWMKRSRHRPSIGKTARVYKGRTRHRTTIPKLAGGSPVGDQDVPSRGGAPTSSVYIALMTMAEIPSGIPIPFASHLSHASASRGCAVENCSQVQMRSIMKAQFQNIARLELSALMTVAAILIAGFLTKLVIATDVFHRALPSLSHCSALTGESA